MSQYNLLWLLTLCIILVVVRVDGHVTGTIIAVDKNLATQKIVINDTHVIVDKPNFVPSNQQFLPLNQFIPPMTAGNQIVTIANNSVVFVDDTDSGFDFTFNSLQCTPHAIAGPLPSGIMYGLCPNYHVFAIEPPNNVHDHQLRRIPNSNGTLLIGSAPNYALHYITGDNGNVFIKNIDTGRSSSISVPSCSHVNNVQVVSNNFLAIFCASNASTPSIVTCVHFRNLTVDNYVSVNLTKPITGTTLVRSFNSMVILAFNNYLHVIDQVKGQTRHFCTNEIIADINIVNETLAYYITSKLVRFSPLDTLDGYTPPSQESKMACGPPRCAFMTNVNEELILYAITSNSFGISEKDTTTRQINLDISPLFFIHNLTYYPSTLEESPTPIKPHNKSSLIVVFSIVAAVLVSILTVVSVLVIFLIKVIKSKSRPFSSKESSPIEETSPTSSIQEQGQSVQESDQTGGQREYIM